jgi:hypothetical protein
MQHLLTKLAAAAIVVGAAIGSGQAHAGPLPNLNPSRLASEAAPFEKAGYYRYRYGGFYPYERSKRPYPYWYYRPYYGYRQALSVAIRLSPLFPALVVARPASGPEARPSGPVLGDGSK